MRDIIRLLVRDAQTIAFERSTRRDIRLPVVSGKAFAIIGMRRSGKTTFLRQCAIARLDSGVPRDAVLHFQFEDERLAGLRAEHLHLIVEEFYLHQPQLRDRGRAVFLFDEIQVIPGWETFVRRIMDHERADVFVTGSSARLLSREVATAMRGRAMEVLVHPFGFRESLRHAGCEPDRPWRESSKGSRSMIDRRLQDYLLAGGFPEAQGVEARDRAGLLRTYADVAVLRDVIDRHAISNPVALRMMQRHLLANPCAPFSVQKFYDSLRSQGVAVGKDTLHEDLARLEDTFLVRSVFLHTASERRRMVHPRKVYPVDPGLIPVYERTGRRNVGHALETVVLIELERRGSDVSYVVTADGREVDFLVADPLGARTLIQVTADLSDPVTRDREVRALLEAAGEITDATVLILTLDSVPPDPPLPPPIRWMPAAEWLLDG